MKNNYDFVFIFISDLDHPLKYEYYMITDKKVLDLYMGQQLLLIS